MLNCPIGTSDGGALIRTKTAYFCLLIVLVLTIATLSFIRVRGQGLSNVSLWIFALPFVLTLARTRLGLVVTVFLLTITPALHHQLNALTGARFYAWAYPGADACLGFLFAWVCKGQLTAVRNVLARFPAGLLLLFHAWIALSGLVAVTRNLWQSASEFSARGLVYNVWLVRGISWLDDYYPLQDLFFYSAAFAMLFGVWAVLAKEGGRLLRPLVLAVLAGAVVNVAFALWQMLTGRGWVDGDLAVSVNALWPDLHSFGAFMAVALFVGYGILKTQPSSIAIRLTMGLAMMAAAAGLYLSTSRATLFIVCLGLVIWGGWFAFKLEGWRRAVPLMAIIALLSAIEWILTQGGYRGFTHDSLRSLLEGFNADKLNAALSHRPEIWGAATDMYLAYPFFGLGQGSFYRLSSLPSFSRSDVLLGLGGSSAHNYFLQTFVELGPVGLTFALLIAIPVLRLGKQNLSLVSFYALLGIAVGNVYAHSLLVRESLMLCAVFGGVYFWESQEREADKWRPLGSGTTRIVLWGVVGLALLAVIEVSQSFGRVPFKFGELCYEQRPIAQDGWTSGRLRHEIPAEAVGIELGVQADRPDLERRPLTVLMSVATESGTTLWERTMVLSQRMNEPRRFSIELQRVPNGKRFLLIQTSHCLVPLNLGLTYEPRRLGLRITGLRSF